MHNVAEIEIIAKGEAAYVPLPKIAPGKIKIKIKPGVISPIKIAPVPVAEIVEKPAVEEESRSVWWWLSGAICISFAALIMHDIQ